MRPTPARIDCRAFSMIELLVCMGVILVLAGILLPTLRGSRESAILLRSSVQARTNASLMTAYCADNRDTIPYWNDLAVAVAMDFGGLLQQTGYVASLRETDPEGVDKHGFSRFSLSTAVVADPKYFRPGSTVRTSQLPAAPTKLSGVLYPAEKGVAIQWLHVRGAEHVLWGWNPAERPRSGFARADGSSAGVACTDFRLEHDFFEYDTGVPVLMTWGGYRGRDATRDP